MIKCDKYDCGWCYHDDSDKTNSSSGGCYKPKQCPYYIILLEKYDERAGKV